MATNLNISENQERVSLRVGSGGLPRSITPDNGSPYYVGARAYVTQNPDGATVTIIDKEGTTTANIYNGTSGTTDYTEMTNKPQIEGVTLEGNKSFPELTLEYLTNLEIEALLT